MPQPRRFGLAVQTRLSDDDAAEFIRRCTSEGQTPSELARELIHRALQAA